MNDEAISPSTHLLRLNNGAALDFCDIELFERFKKTVHLNSQSKGLQERIINEFRESLFAGADSSEERLNALLSKFISMLAERLGGHSALFWLTMFRSLLGMNDPTTFAEPLDFMRQIRVLESAVLNFGRTDPSDVHFDGGMWWIEVSDDDIRSILEACVVGGLAAHVRIDLRRVALGGQLTVTEDGWRVVLSVPGEELAEIFTRRADRFANIFQYAGVPGAAILPPGRGAHWFSMAARNAGPVHWHGHLKALVPATADNAPFVRPQDAYLPQFVLSDFSLDQTRPWLEMIADTLRRDEGFSPVGALCLFQAIASLGIEAFVSDFRIGHRLRSLALMLSRKDALVQRAMQVAQDSDLARETSIAEFEAALDFFLRFSDGEGITAIGSVSVRHHLTAFGDLILIDYFAAFGAVRHLLEQIAQQHGNAANQRGAAFEAFVAAQFSQGVEGARVWVSSQRIRFADRKTREIDVAVIIGNTLLLCECKAIARRPADDVPTAARVSNRLKGLRAAIEQVDSLARKISTTAIVGGIRLPAEVECVVPCVLTVGVEWTDDASAEAWLVAGEIPRACTLGEAVELANRLRDGFPVRSYPIMVQP